jgi:hypothetical protein
MKELTIKFSGDEVSEARRALRATECLCELHDFSNFLRSIDKYEDLTEAESALIGRIRDRFGSTLGDFLRDLE